jgi:hypothetical protein
MDFIQQCFDKGMTEESWGWDSWDSWDSSSPGCHH